MDLLCASSLRCFTPISSISFTSKPFTAISIRRSLKSTTYALKSTVEKEEAEEGRLSGREGWKKAAARTVMALIPILAAVEGLYPPEYSSLALPEMQGIGVPSIPGLLAEDLVPSLHAPALDNPAPVLYTMAEEPTSPCNNETHPSEDTPVPSVVSNESIVQEAWQVVNDYFFDARHHLWSSSSWQMKKEEIFKRPIPSRLAAYGIIRSMVRDLNDPYSRFISPRELKELAKYDITGIGLSLGEVVDSDGVTTLQAVGILLGSPAQYAGIKQGDEILSVDGTSVVGKSAFEASSLIQGPKGTLVTLEVKHGPCGERSHLIVKREQNIRTPVSYRLEHSSSELTGYIRLKEFNAVAKRDLLTAMDRLRAAGATSFVLDLQDNPGGLVQAGIEIARLFLKEGETVIYTVGKDPKSLKSIIATDSPVTTAPLLVLVNDHTASASEIVAAALHDNCRAVLVGSKTFGKGLIQSVFELSDGSGVILTVGKYATPSHHDIDGNGIETDFSRFPGLSEAKKKLEKCHIPA